MSKLNWKPIKTFAGKALELIGYGALVTIAYKLDVSRNDVSIIPTSEGYSEAVDVILKSDMWSSDKKKAVSLLKRNADPELYKAIISIVNDKNMWSSDKVDTIEMMSK